MLGTGCGMLGLIYCILLGLYPAFYYSSSWLPLSSEFIEGPVFWNSGLGFGGSMTVDFEYWILNSGSLVVW